jgi:hypothetical protein
VCLPAVDTLLLAWAVIGQTDATSATITALNKDSFTLSAACRGAYTGAKYTKETTFEFEPTTPFQCRADVAAELAVLKAKSRVVCWPPGPGALVAIFILIGSLSCTAEMNTTTTSIYLQTMRSMSMVAFRTIQNAQIAVVLLVLSHAAEAVYVASVCKRLKFTKFQTASWVSMVMLLGYPCTARIRFLEKVSISSSNSSSNSNSYSSTSAPAAESDSSTREKKD